MRVFAHLFPWQVTTALLAGLITTAFLFDLAYEYWEGKEISSIKSLFAVINMTFFQLTYADMPTNSYLDVFPVIVPLVGLPLFSLFGLRIIKIIRIFFVRRERGPEWQEALVQSTITNHIVICGLGRVGYRVARRLAFDYGKPLVGINDTQSGLVEDLLVAGLPVILGDTVHEEVLKKAGIERARVVVVCTDKDWINLSTAAHIRKLNRQARIVLRLFEDELQEDIKTSFTVDSVISRSAVAAMTFTYAAIGGQIVETFELAERTYVLAQVPLGPTSPMLGRTIGEVAEEQDVTVVCHNRGPVLTVQPAPDTRLSVNDNLFVFTTVAEMIELIEYGVRHHTISPSPHQGPILVCGLGHTGYRVATNLLNLGCQVVALDFEAGRLSSRLSELDVPLKFGDLRWNSILTEADIMQATAIVACAEDDLTNLQVILRARKLNPTIRVVMRIFDDRLSDQLRQTFGAHAVYSTSALATPDFVAAALDRTNIRFVDVGGMVQTIARLQVKLAGLKDVLISELHGEEGLTVLLHARDSQVNIPPQQETHLQVGDEIVVLASEAKLAELNRRNKTSQELITEGYI